MEDREFLKVKEVAKHYRISCSGILNKIHAGKLEAVKIGGSYRLYAEQFKELEKKPN